MEPHLLQAYAGFVFEGPGLTKEIVNGVRRKTQGFSEFTSSRGSNRVLCPTRLERQMLK